MADLTVAPGATYEAVLEWGTTGATIGMRVIDNAGNTTVARVTGFTEYPAGSGIYSRTSNTAPSTSGQYTLVYDDDGGTAAIGHVATQDLLVTGSAAQAITSGNEYITSANLKTTLNLSGQTFADTDIGYAIQAASRAIDEYCGQRFYLDSAATAVRYYTAIDPYWVTIDAAASVATVALDTAGQRTWSTAITDYDTEPINASQDGKPYTQLAIKPNGTHYFPFYRNSVKVTAQFGWPAVPGPVTEACTILASRLLKRAREAPFGVAGFGIDGAAVRISRMDPDVAMLLEPYVKRTLAL